MLSRIFLRASSFIIFFAMITTACNNAVAIVNETQSAESITPLPSATEPIAATNTPPPTQVPSPTLEDSPTVTPSLTPSLTPSPTLPANNVTGKICFPDSDIPEMTIYLEETNNETLVEIPVEQGQSSYKAKLSPGTYIAYAWLKDFSQGALYSRAVPCGLGSDCTDHSLLPITVERGQVLDGIDICDWFAGPFNVPYPPHIERTELTGNVTGGISYIEGQETPGLRVVAFNQNTEYWYWVYTQPGQTAYTLTDLPPGTYHLLAYDGEGRAGGYADNEHNLIDVIVNSGETTSGADITDWNAPQEAFPPDPTR